MLSAACRGYSSEAMVFAPDEHQGGMGLSGTRRPGTVYLAAVWRLMPSGDCPREKGTFILQAFLCSYFRKSVYSPQHSGCPVKYRRF